MDEKLTVDIHFEKQEEDMISRSKDLELGIVDPDMKLRSRGPKSIKNAKKETRTQEEDTERESSAPGREPSLEEVAEKMGIPLERVWSMLKAGREPVSLQGRIREEGDTCLGDFIEDKGDLSPPDMVIHSNLADHTRKLLATLRAREEEILRMRFGIGEKNESTLEQVGQEFSLSRERIRRIEEKALRRLRHPGRSEPLKELSMP